MSEQRLIDANALKKRIINFCGCVPYVEERMGGSHGILYLDEAVDSAPTVPAEVVVYCRECKHGHPAEHAFEGDGVTPLICCGYMTEPNRPHEYCSWGERREDGKT